MTKIEVLIGPVASGKSTYARKRANESALIISHDNLTQMLHGGVYRYEQGLRECYRRMEESIAWAGLTAGRDVVIDRTHLTCESRQRWIRWADTYDSMQTFEGNGPDTPVVAVVFPDHGPGYHAQKRFMTDPRGRSFEDWLAVAKHHAQQAVADPLREDEGFDDIVRLDFDPVAGGQFR